jgi:transposase
MNTSSPRLRRPERYQVEMRCLSLDQMLSDDHVARVVWDYVQGLDLTPLLAKVKAVAGAPGQPANDPRVLLALWLLATVHGVGSARELARRCDEHVAYQWICGGVSMNYHSLADFRTEHVDFLDRLLTDGVAALLQQGLVTLTHVAQDGMRVRASAGRSSFRRAPTLARCLEEAQAQVAALRVQADEDVGAASRRQQAAQERAARERGERIAAALAATTQLAQRRQQVETEKGVAAKEPRASTTDPEARVMKMADGGFRPAYNVQAATTTQSGVIVGVDVIAVGSDRGQLSPMVEQLEQRYEAKPQALLADGDFAALDDVERLATEHGVVVYAPVKDEVKKRAAGVDPFTPRAKDGPGVAAWRSRMGTVAAQTLYKQRAATAEWANAGMRNRGLYQFRVRGRPKVLAVVLWHALAHNLLRAATLRAERAAEEAARGG